jgi:CheY-like chemotaxis protein
MSEPRKILAVDERKTTLDFLRSVLPLIEGEQFEINCAFSAEEGLLELRRQPYDLLVTGFRLPGMDGLELGRRAKSLRPEMGLILVTGRPLSELQERAAACGIDHLLNKPLDAEEFLLAVKESLSPEPLAATPDSQAQVIAEKPALPAAVTGRLELLGEETGAGQVLLASVSGEILHTTGGQLHRDAAGLVLAASAGVSRALELSQQLDEDEPRAVQFVQGSTTDFYWANVGRDYFVAILFDAQIRRGRIGTVWVFTQRAVRELQRLLPEAASGAPPASSGPAKKKAPIEPAKSPDAATRPATGVDAAQATPVDDEPAIEDEGLAAESAGQPAESGEAEDDQATDSVQEASAEPPQAGGQERSPEDLALDAFWEEALADDGGDFTFGAGISLDEAKAKGLVAKDFDPDNSEGESEQ